MLKCKIMLNLLLGHRMLLNLLQGHQVMLPFLMNLLLLPPPFLTHLLLMPPPFLKNLFLLLFFLPLMSKGSLVHVIQYFIIISTSVNADLTLLCNTLKSSSQNLKAKSVNRRSVSIAGLSGR